MWKSAEISRPWRLATLLLLGIGASVSNLQADEGLLTVRLASGREFTARVDARTNEELLWLRFSSGGGNLLRPVAWSRITAARTGTNEIEITDLAAACDKLKSTSPSRKAPAGVAPAASLTASPTSVAFIRISAWMANWDADVEPDGICLQLEPRDAQGEVVAASGTADVELFAPRARKFHEAPQSGGWSTELVERWTENVTEEKIGPQGVVLKLPLGAIHPDFSAGVDRWGLIHVRFVVPGSGVFEQSLDGVHLRSWSPVRERLYQQSGRRYFSTEGTQRY
jgi:hypothetical protein